MSISVSEKYLKKVCDKLYLKSVVIGKTNQEYSWDGQSAIIVPTITSVALNDYNIEASANRYGTPTEVQDTTQKLEITRDRSFSLVVDKGNNSKQQMIKGAGKVLGIEMNEQAVPEMDKYALSIIAAKAGNVSVDESLDSETFVPAIFKARTAFVNAKLGRKKDVYCFVPSSSYALMLADKRFYTLEQLGTKVFEEGEIGSCANFKIIEVPDDYLPEDVNFLCFWKKAVPNPLKFKDTTIHQNPPGINGHLIEGRLMYDTFVLDTLKLTTYVSLKEARSV